MNNEKLNARERALDPVSASDNLDVIHGTAGWPKPVTSILLVEDMATLRNITRGFLRLQGYEVVTAENGREALEILQRSNCIELVITDVSMPEMGGVELVSHGRKLLSDLKVIFSSGYVEVDFEASGISAANTLVLQKPYSLSLLARSVREVLETTEQKKSA